MFEWWWVRCWTVWVLCFLLAYFCDGQRRGERAANYVRLIGLLDYCCTLCQSSRWNFHLVVGSRARSRLSHSCTYLEALRDWASWIEMLYNVSWLVWLHKLFRGCAAPVTLHLRHTICIWLQKVSDLDLLLLLVWFLLPQIIETHIAWWSTVLHNVDCTPHL